MKRTSNSHSEHGSPGEEFPRIHRQDLPSEWNRPDTLREPSPAPEFPNPCPEITPPGAFAWESPNTGESKPRIRLGISLLSAVLILVFTLGPFSSDTPAVTVPEETQPSPTVMATEPVWDAPVCEIVGYGFSSEIHGHFQFHNMESVTGVTLEIWDTLMQTPEYSIDITQQAITEGAYRLESFYTSSLYQKYKAEYDAAQTYPGEVQFRVTIQYEHDGTLLSNSFCQTTAQENGWYITYVPENGYVSDWSVPGCFMFITFEYPQPPEILFQPSGEILPGTLLVQAEINGEPLPVENAEIRREEIPVIRSDGTTGTLHRTTVVLPRPSALPENQGSTAHFSVTQYLESLHRVWTTEQDIEF